jgi:hypothetical protein
LAEANENNDLDLLVAWEQARSLMARVGSVEGIGGQERFSGGPGSLGLNRLEGDLRRARCPDP